MPHERNLRLKNSSTPLKRTAHTYANGENVTCAVAILSYAIPGPTQSKILDDACSQDPISQDIICSRGNVRPSSVVLGLLKT